MIQHLGKNMLNSHNNILYNLYHFNNNNNNNNNNNKNNNNNNNNNNRTRVLKEY